MSKPEKPISQMDIVNVLKQVDDDPESFGALMETWNAIFEISQRSGQGTFSDVEQAALLSPLSKAENQPRTSVGGQIGQLLERFSSPAFLVRENGIVLAQNTEALSAFNIGPENTLDDLPFDLEGSERIEDLVRATLQPTRNTHDAILKRAYSRTDDSSVTLSIAPSKLIEGGHGEALVFVVDARWKTAAADLIKREFSLTEAEKELLASFLDGQSTQDMAAARNRSHATVRTQFHSLMTKMGARNQTELFRNALSVSQFVDKISEITKVLRNPHRNQVDLIRPGGRSVEVTICGDRTGKPLIFMQSLYTYTFEARIEKAFHDAGICLLCICRPGYGNTDPAPDGKTYIETIADDMSALLDQLGHDKCLIMSGVLTPALMFQMAPHMVDRLLGLVQLTGNVPRHYISDKDVKIPWIKGLFRASIKHPAMMDFLIKAGLRAYRTMGQARFLSMQFKGDQIELENFSRPEAQEVSQNALDTSTKQGYDAVAFDIRLSVSDYRDEIEKTDLPILVLHGAKNQLCSVHAVRNFVQDYQDRITYVEFPEGTISAFDQNVDEVIRQISAFYDENADTPS